MNEKFLKILFKDCSRGMVGRLCKQIEILQDKKDLSERQKFNLLKDFNRELVYEEFRNILNQVKVYNKGLNYKKFNITPSSPKNCD